MSMWVYRGLQLLMIGLLVHLITTRYERYLQTDRCPFCKEEVPDGADLCPSCYRQLTGVTGIDLESVISTATLLFLMFCVTVFSLLPFPTVP